MENKQTAVEWFLDQLIEHRIIIVNKTTYQVKYKHEILLEQAKEMEKEQAQRTFKESRLTNSFVGFKHKTFEEYYAELYGGNK